MLVDYAVTEMGHFEDYSGAAPRAKTIKETCITTFLFHISLCITFRQINFVTATLVSGALLKSSYSRLGFKVIKDFATSSNFEKVRKRFNYVSEKSKALQKNNWLIISSNYPTTC